MTPRQEPFADLPFVTTAQMREADRLMMEEFGVTLLQMMENAGRNLARLARDMFLNSDPRGKRVAVLAGPGGNGGGGMAAARRLAAWGASVEVWLAGPSDGLGEAAAQQLSALRAVGVPVREADDESPPPRAEVVLDALLGYSLEGAPRGGAGMLIRAANAGSAPVLSLDVPSGVDASSGQVHDPAIRAEVTLTLALPKTGLAAARDQVGDLYVGDIGVPPQLWERPEIGVTVGPVFHRSELLRVW